MTPIPPAPGDLLGPGTLARIHQGGHFVPPMSVAGILNQSFTILQAAHPSWRSREGTGS